MCLGFVLGMRRKKNCTVDVPKVCVYRKSVKSGNTHGIKIVDWFLTQALDDTDLVTCVNGEWIIRATKYDSTITPETVWLRNDTARIYPRKNVL